MKNRNHKLSKYYTEILGLRFSGNVLVDKEEKELNINKELLKLDLDKFSPTNSFVVESELERLSELNSKKEITEIEYSKIKDSNNNVVGGIIKYDFVNDKNILAPKQIVIINSKDYEMVHNVYSEEKCNIFLKGKYAIKGCISINPFSNEIEFQTINRLPENTSRYFFSINQLSNNIEEKEINVKIHKYGKSFYQKVTADFSKYNRAELEHSVLSGVLPGSSKGISINFSDSEEKTLKYTYSLTGEMQKINQELLYGEPVDCSVKDAIADDITKNNMIQEIRRVLIFIGLKRDIIEDMIKDSRTIEKQLLPVVLPNLNDMKNKSQKNFNKTIKTNKTQG